MGSKFTERPGETTDQEAALHQQAMEVAARREQYHRRMRIVTIGAGVVAALAILGFLFVTLVLPRLAPAAPGTSLNPTQQAVLSLPPMSNDMGFWDRIPSKPNPTQEAVLSLPPMSNDMGFWDRIASKPNPTQEAVLSLPPMSNDMGFWDRIPGRLNPTQQAVLSLPPMSNDMGFWDRIPSR